MTQALDYMLKGELFAEYFRKDANAEARRLHKEAIKVDPAFARPYACCAYAVLQAHLYNWYEGSPEAAIAEMSGFAEEAVQKDGADYWNHWMQAAVVLYSQKDFDDAKAKYAAVELKVASDAIPEDKRAFLVDNADMLLLTGNAKKAITDVNNALQSGVPERWFYWVLGWAFYVDQQYEKSLSALANFHNPRNAIRKNVIANLAALKRQDEAISQAILFVEEEKFQGIVYAKIGDPVFPGLSLIEDRVPFESSAQRDVWKGHLMEGFKGVNQT